MSEAPPTAAPATKKPHLSRRFWFALVGFIVPVAVNLFFCFGDNLFGIKSEGPLSWIAAFTLYLPAALVGRCVGYTMMSSAEIITCMLVFVIVWGLLGALIGFFFAWLFPGKRVSAAE